MPLTPTFEGKLRTRVLVCPSRVFRQQTSWLSETQDGGTGVNEADAGQSRQTGPGYSHSVILFSSPRTWMNSTTLSSSFLLALRAGLKITMSHLTERAIAATNIAMLCRQAATRVWECKRCKDERVRKAPERLSESAGSGNHHFGRRPGPVVSLHDGDPLGRPLALVKNPRNTPLESGVEG